jgi:hypothetical protein
VGGETVEYDAREEALTLEVTGGPAEELLALMLQKRDVLCGALVHGSGPELILRGLDP